MKKSIGLAFCLGFLFIWLTPSHDRKCLMKSEPYRLGQEMVTNCIQWDK